MTTKYNHELQVNNGVRILDPIGKMSFNEQVVASTNGSIHTIDLEKSSNFIVKLEEESSWVKFINYESSKIHRFDVLLINEHSPLSSMIFDLSKLDRIVNFGIGNNNHYTQPQLDLGNETPSIFWIYDIPTSVLDLRDNRQFSNTHPSNNTNSFTTSGTIMLHLDIKNEFGGTLISPLDNKFGGELHLRRVSNNVIVDTANIAQTYPPETYYLYADTLDEYYVDLSDLDWYEYTGGTWNIVPYIDRLWRFLTGGVTNCNITFRYSDHMPPGFTLLGYITHLFQELEVNPEDEDLIYINISLRPFESHSNYWFHYD